MSSYKLKHKYVWKELTSDGLLKDPENCGPYYEQENINGWGWDGGYNSEEEAYQAFIEFKTKHEFGTPSRLILIKESHAYDADWRK